MWHFPSLIVQKWYLQSQSQVRGHLFPQGTGNIISLHLRHVEIPFSLEMRRFNPVFFKINPVKTYWILKIVEMEKPGGKKVYFAKQKINESNGNVFFSFLFFCRKYKALYYYILILGACMQPKICAYDFLEKWLKSPKF